ncbi:phage tail protein [Salmonella enterica]|nr:phage tail protein [Salmonella enterica]HEC8457750.1 phage tail protein [Salmonella enterica subsp. enterica serovar Poona]
MPAFPKFKTIITDYGKQRLIAAMSPGETKLTLTQMAVGDGGGNPTNPDTTNTALVNEVWRAAVNSVTVDKTHPNIIIVELLIPAEVGGFWIREAGIYDEFNKLVAICSLPASEKPLLEQGSGRAQTVRMTLVISDLSTINITIDSTTIIATNDYVDNSLKEHEKSRNHPDATLTDKGFTKLYSGVTSLDETMAATPKAVKIAMDNASARLAKERNLADLTNIPLARQSLQLGNSATRNVGTTQGTVAAGDDTRITGAMQKNQNGADIPNKPLFIEILGLKETLNPTKRVSIGNLGNGAFDGSTPCINIGDSDSGFIGSQDGVLDIYCNNVKVGYIDNDGLHMIADVSTNRNVVLQGDERRHIIINNADGSPRAYIYKDKGDTGIHINNGVDGGGDFIFGKDGGFYAPSTLNIGNTWIASDGNIWGTRWNASGAWLWESIVNQLNTRATIDYVNQTFVRDVRAGYVESAQVWRAYGYGDQAPFVITGVMNGNQDDLIDNLTRRPLQKNINGIWYNIGFI